MPDAHLSDSGGNQLIVGALAFVSDGGADFGQMVADLKEPDLLELRNRLFSLVAKTYDDAAAVDVLVRYLVLTVEHEIGARWVRTRGVWELGTVS